MKSRKHKFIQLTYFVLFFQVRAVFDFFIDRYIYTSDFESNYNHKK